MSSSTIDLAALTAVLLQTGHRPETSTGCQVSFVKGVACPVPRCVQWTCIQGVGLG